MYIYVYIYIYMYIYIGIYLKFSTGSYIQRGCLAYITYIHSVVSHKGLGERAGQPTACEGNKPRLKEGKIFGNRR